MGVGQSPPATTRGDETLDGEMWRCAHTQRHEEEERLSRLRTRRSNNTRGITVRAGAGL